jgi:GNAT superfamily N-acetyltransferase
MSEDYDIVQVGTERNDLRPCGQLLADVFGRHSLFTTDYIKWQYADNPDGSIVGYNALSGRQLAAHYVTQPLQAMIGGSLKRGLLSLNTVTHPAHQGKGLFVNLAERTYKLAADMGYSFVIGVANQNSVHGFIKRLGFTQVGQLHALLGIGVLPFSSDMNKFAYSRHWTQEALSWRLQNPSAKYGVSIGKQIKVSSPTAYPGIKATVGVFDSAAYKLERKGSSPALMNLWIGANRDISNGARAYFNIPLRWRPAPLYLIFKPLEQGLVVPKFDDVFFQALDFDAY